MNNHPPPMQKQRSIYVERLRKFISPDSVADGTLLKAALVDKDDCSVKLAVWSAPMDRPRPTFNDAIKNTFSPTQTGAIFGPAWSTHWFRVLVNVPKGFEGDNVVFRWQTDTESLVWTTDGRAIHGLSSQDRTEFDLSLVGECTNCEFYIEMACNSIFGNGKGKIIAPPDEQRQFVLEAAELRRYSKDIIKLLGDIKILLGLIESLPDDPVSREALFVANQIMNTFGNPSICNYVAKCQELADNFLASRGAGSRFVISAVGNCHIDTAWLWPYNETRRKTARSWSAQLDLIAKHPKYIFVASQMQQFEWLRHDYPDLFARIAEEAKKKRFVPIGGSWVEMDGNLPAGESFVRQFLYGQSFMKRHFGLYSDVFWLPDTFGYNAQLPQLMAQSGMRYFVTQKMSWNSINQFPHSSFWWQGLDGTNVLAHFPPANTYTSSATVKDLVQTERGHRDGDRSHCALLPYGYGDGGGGPTSEMLLRLERLAASRGCVAQIEFETPRDFFRRLESESSQLLTWKGELYLEFHRGTYTSQAVTKYYNRQCEILLREAEMLSVIRNLLRGPPEEDTREEIRTLWKDVLLNQFHDVLPGSSIKAVYNDATRLYENVGFRANYIRYTAANASFGNDLTPNEDPAQASPKIKSMRDLACLGKRSSPTQDVVFFNTTPYERDEVFAVPWDGSDFSSPQPGVLAVAGIKGYAMATFADTRVPMGAENQVC